MDAKSLRDPETLRNLVGHILSATLSEGGFYKARSQDPSEPVFVLEGWFTGTSGSGRNAYLLGTSLVQGQEGRLVLLRPDRFHFNVEDRGPEPNWQPLNADEYVIAGAVSGGELVMPSGFDPSWGIEPVGEPGSRRRKAVEMALKGGEVVRLSAILKTE